MHSRKVWIQPLTSNCYLKMKRLGYSKNNTITFECSTYNILRYKRNIYKTKELDKYSVVEGYSVTTSDGKNYKISTTK